MHTTTPAQSLFEHFVEPTGSCSTFLREAITAAWRKPETQAITEIIAAARLPKPIANRSHELARRIVINLRQRKTGKGRAGIVQNLMQEYSLSSQEGIALMCLAEALLRIPDSATRDALIRDKIAQGQWQTHLGKSPSLFVNATTWGLLITGKLISTHSETGLTLSLGRLVSFGGEPLIRKGIDIAIRMLGEQFVTGETIEKAIAKGGQREKEGFRYSFDMLGEAAITANDAARYLRDYESAIHAIGKASAGRGIFNGPGISIKLSALHPRYCRAQYSRVMSELYPVLVRLCSQAKHYDIGLNIDAEEADRLEISLDILEKLCFEPDLQGWMGLGFVIQAYQKRCPFVIDYIVDLARRSHRRLMVRLVKGAYWDSEIKRAQLDGQEGYPVYTRKPYTDASYIACARKLLAAPDAVYPQFATHNAHTLSAIFELANPRSWYPEQYEFQCLHGMGEELYEYVVGNTNSDKLGRPCRIYAPVGTHETLLAYLVRRLLENGANTSFVNRIADQNISIDELIKDPVEIIETYARTEGKIGLPHSQIPLPIELYGPKRANSRGVDLTNEHELNALNISFQGSLHQKLKAEPLLAADTSGGEMQPIVNPALNTDIVGLSREATTEEIKLSISSAATGALAWAAVSPVERARMLEATADYLEAQTNHLMALLIREAGKTASNAIAEVREAVDFLRYYSRQVRDQFDNNTHKPLGLIVCISPWNFPLAIFIGQVSAALAAGNVVLAKPAEQTSLIATESVRALWAAGIPRSAVQLLLGRGAVVGAKLVADPRIQGVLFTGSTEVARMLQRTLAGRIGAHGRAIPLIAETGGQNAMIVDSSALAEQVTTDVLTSAFDSAGQRCSALRVLCVQKEVAERVLHMLLGAMSELIIDRPDHLATDIGPVIDAKAKANIERHIENMRAKGHRVHQMIIPSEHSLDLGTFIPPTLIEIDSICELDREVFGPVLHFMRYERDNLEDLLSSINRHGYGLTMGLHTRINETISKVASSAHVGNLYVNRNMVGATVGVQPFGGEGLSGTGPKAGGPLYLYRLLSKRPDEVLVAALSGLGTPSKSANSLGFNEQKAFKALAVWADQHNDDLAQLCSRFTTISALSDSLTLAGPTGELNIYNLVPRSSILCLANDNDRLAQLAAILAVGGQAVWPEQAASLLERLPAEVQARVSIVKDWTKTEFRYELVLLHGSTEELAQVQQQLARRDGAVISVERLQPGERTIPLERLVIERSLSVNIAAAGGNTSLMTLS